MATVEAPHIEMHDHVTGEEIEGMSFPIAIVPRAGERIHYWQDGFPEAAGVDSGIRRDFLVMRVEHDWRYMPARSGGGSARYVPSVILYVLAQGDEEEFPAPPRKRKPTHPGVVAQEAIEALGLSVDQASRRLETTPTLLSGILKGRLRVRPGMAQKMGQLFGNGAALWIRMQAAVDLWDAEHGEQQ